jgi:phage/plasmid-associated DNA primase
VHDATESYRVDSDPLAQFVDDECVVGVDVSVGANELYRAYRQWAEEQRFAPRETLTNTLFGSRMTMKFERRRTKRGNRYVGVGLLSEHADPAAQGLLNDIGGVGVQGLVQGCESDDSENEVTSRENDSTRENLEIAYTPYTPTPEEPCRGGCGALVPAGRKCSTCAAAAAREWAQR